MPRARKAQQPPPPPPPPPSDNTPTWEWEEYVKNLTGAGLRSADECHTHLDMFTEHLVASGLVDTPLRNDANVIATIATFLRNAVDVPHAAALRVITEEARRIHLRKTCEYIGKKAQECAVLGEEFVTTVELLKQPPPFVQSLNRTFCDDGKDMEDVLQEIHDTLCQLGYDVSFRWPRCQAKGYNFNHHCNPPTPRGLWRPPCIRDGSLRSIPDVRVAW